MFYKPQQLMALKTLFRPTQPLINQALNLQQTQAVQAVMAAQAPYLNMLMSFPKRTAMKTSDEKKEEKEKKAFQDDINYFLGKQTFSLHDFHEKVLNGLKQKSTVRSMIFGEDAEIKVLEEQNKICSAMYDDEKNDYKLISKEKKQEIAEVTQLKADDVQDLIHKYVQMRDFHGWLKGKQARKEPMPESRDELMHMYRVERPKFLFKNKPKGGAKQSMMKFYLRRHRT